MTVKELKELLNRYDENTRVTLTDFHYTEFDIVEVHITPEGSVPLYVRI